LPVSLGQLGLDARDSLRVLLDFEAHSRAAPVLRLRSTARRMADRTFDRR
jgi:hypothetical protein